MGVSSGGCVKAVGRRPAQCAEFDRSRIGPSAATTQWRAPTMPNGMRWVGLDVHAHASTVAVFDDGTGEVITRRVVGRPLEVLDVLRGLPRPLRAVYEAGPTGYGLVRRARAEGIEMAVCSPGNIERRAGRSDQDRQARRDPAGAVVRGRRPAAGLGPQRGAGAAARSGALPRGSARGPDARAASAGDVPAAPRALLPRAGGALDAQAPPLALPAALRRRPVARHLCRLPARPRRVAGAPRAGRARARADRAELCLGRDDRAVALPARHQHADRARAVRRDR